MVYESGCVAFKECPLICNYVQFVMVSVGEWGLDVATEIEKINESALYGAWFMRSGVCRGDFMVGVWLEILIW